MGQTNSGAQLPQITLEIIVSSVIGVAVWGQTGSCDEVAFVSPQERDCLTRLKQARDALRTDTVRLRQKGGLVAHSGLLRDFQERRDQVLGGLQWPGGLQGRWAAVARWAAGIL